MNKEDDNQKETTECNIDSVSVRFYSGDELNNIPFGLYKIYWNEEAGGGNSIASVGNMHDGVRWIAPTNWTSENNPTDRITNHISSIEKMELLYKQGH